MEPVSEGMVGVDGIRGLLRRVRGAAFVADVDGVVVGWSPEAALRLGHAEAAALGRRCEALLDGHDGAAWSTEGPLLGPVRAGRTPAPQTVTLRRGDGERRRFVVGCTVLATQVAGRPWLLFQMHETADEALRPASTDVGLSRREREVLALLARGARGEEIAAHLGIARATVRNHVQRMFRKLSVRSRVEAVARAYRDGLV